MKFGLKEKLIILSLCLVIIPVLIIGLSVCRSAEDAVYTLIKEKLEIQVNAKLDEITTLNKGLEDILKGAVAVMKAKFFADQTAGQQYAEINNSELFFIFSDGTRRKLSVGDHSFIDNIAESLGRDFVATVFKVENNEAIRVTTSVVKEDGKRAVGTKLGSAVYNEVVYNKKVFSGVADILGQEYFTIYYPLLNLNGEVTCILFAGIKSKVFLNDFKTQLLATKVGKTGYMYVMDKSGKLIIHPNSEGKNIYENDFARKMCAERNGYILYSWEGKPKVVAYAYYEPKEWIIASGSYLSDFTGPLLKIMRTILLIGALSIILGSLAAVIFASRIIKSLTQVIESLDSSSEQTMSAAGEVSSASQQLSQGATEQAASLEETSSSLDELNSMIRQNADNSDSASRLAQAASDAAGDGDSAMVQMQTAMNDINVSSEKISKIIEIIKEIAFQTNLLALNASVEAARAGDHGKGFAVVADEVRNLAQRAAAAAQDTKILIEDSIGKVKAGAQIADSAGESLKNIMESSKKVADIIHEIATASREQSEGISQITDAVSQMDQVTQQNASVAEESASASEELSAQAEALRDMIVHLQNIVGLNTQ